MGSKDHFFHCLENIPGDFIEDKNQQFFKGIIWKHVDTQHVEHGCIFLPRMIFYVDRFLKKNIIRHIYIALQKWYCMTTKLHIFFINKIE